MSQDETTTSAEDLELEGSESEAVVGGRISPEQFQSEIRKLEHEGYIEQSCVADGTVMYNPKTKRHRMVKW